MRHLCANTFMADRGARLVGTYACPPPPPGGRVRTAPVAPPPATGAGNFMQDREAASRLAHTQEIAGASPAPATSSCAGGVGSAARETAPAEPKFPAQDGAVTLPRGDISLSPKTVLVADTAGTVTLSEASAFILSLVAAHEGKPAGDVLALLIAGAAEAIGIHSLIMRDAHDVDLAELPDFARRAANRFRGGGP